MTLHFYFARRFLFTFLGVLTAFAAVLTLIDLVEHIRRFDGDQVMFVEILSLTLLNTPAGLYRILPLVVILSTLALFLSLARSSELVVTRAAGRSALRSVAAPAIVALLFGAVAVVVMNPIVAATTQRYETLTETYRGEDPEVLSISREGLWLRQGGAEGQTVIRASRSNLDGTELGDVSFLGFGPGGVPDWRVEAERARLTEGAWELTNAKRWNFGEGANPEAEATVEGAMRLPSNLTEDQIRDSFGTPSAVPIWDLPSFIRQLENAGFAARRHRVWLQMELATPLLLSAMVVVAAAFTLRHTRFGRTGIMALMALLMAFTLYFIRNFAQVLGENGQIPIMLAAWGPPVATLLLPLGLLLHLEDG
ncbi:LPS export ABC transporter permease LptG [Roseitranquillus sediminis]|uniref:LPS export ABC transporter permease LptG n=1 Tax=Roseitranquillus sediminis TaxID=2809051 RepID=UPI001D0CB48A|nr:LPS export ABC transporter permease LptG [Roseitranquillus sediminis]MBM9594370.1 LPS export ABC transporter permease LptG [Roseitranquillus sediminis]